MKAKKVLALLLAGVMTLSLVACGGDDTPETTPDPVVETPAATLDPVVEAPPVEEGPQEVSIDFEDGNFDFAMMYTAPVNADPSTLSIADFNGSKALKAQNAVGQYPYVAIDVSSILGADITKVATIEMDLGTQYAGGGFSASSGQIIAWTGDDLKAVSDDWSIFLARSNPKTVESTAADGLFVANANNIIIVYLRTDNGPDEGNGKADFFIDNIRFLDGAGNVLKGDTTVAFNAPAGFVDEGMDMNLFYLADAYELTGFAGMSGGGWSQGYVALSEDEKAMLVPGAIIEIAYNSAEPVWLGYNGSEGWLRSFPGGGDVDYNQPYVAADNTVSQWLYEDLTSFWGEGWVDTIDELFVEAWNDWEIYGVRIGKAQKISVLGNIHEITGFAGQGGGGWSQTYVDLSDEEKAMLANGGWLEVFYEAEGPVWFGYNGAEGWIRAVDEGANYAYELDYEVGFGHVQMSSEAMTKYWPEGWTDSIDSLFFEAWNDFSIIGVNIGTPFAKGKGLPMEVAAFAGKAGGGWSQCYIALSEAELARLGITGSFITVYYEAEGPVWLGYNGDNGWIRAVNEGENYAVELDYAVGDGVTQITYDNMVKYWGEGFTDTLNELFFEGWNDWSVYSLFIGSSN